jgi:4-amino-4-deoxy-L-arabinose transferase-like glycosyltransferase
MRELVRRNLGFFMAVSAAAVLLRLIFVICFPGVVNDSFVYGDIAKNWLEQGIYGLSGPVEVSPTYIRLPGYPAFLALVFAIFGLEHYRAVLGVQVAVDLTTCFVTAAIARRTLGPRAAKSAFVLVALCPFLADYSAAALTETLEVFATAACLYFALRGLEREGFYDWIACGLAAGAAILLRPDGALLPMVVTGYCAVRFLVPRGAHFVPRRRLVQAALVVAGVSILPLVPWTVRNWRVFHEFQPLAPRYANEEGEFIPVGFNRWVKTWIADYVSVEEIYWQVPGSTIDARKLPLRAFDTADDERETCRLISDYNRLVRIPPELDSGFEALAAERIRRHPARYYLGLPLVRIADMWLRPRTEMLPADSRWWEFDDEPRWTALALALGAVNLVYVLSAAAGVLISRKLPGIGLLLAFVALRSAFLGTLENPEPRYTLEMYPVVILMAARALRPSA